MAADRLQRQRLEGRAGSDVQRRHGHGRQQSGGVQWAEWQPARGLRFDAPFTRRLERNDYRHALITYQQTRRSLYQYQDGVNFTLRSLIRHVAAVADQHGDSAAGGGDRDSPRRQDARGPEQAAPPARPTTPGQPAEPVETLGPTVAVNLIYGTQRLAGAQNTFMSVVLNHYENRMLLYRELGIMELDDCGMWIDKPINEADWLTEDECPMPPAIPAEWLQEAGVGLRNLHEGPTEELADPADREAEVMAERMEDKPQQGPVALRKRIAMAVGQDEPHDAEPAAELASSKVPRWVRRRGDAEREAEADEMPAAEPPSRLTASRLREAPPRELEPEAGPKLRR